MMCARDKILTRSDLVKWRFEQKGDVVLTNGCFDLVHVAHLRCLEFARSQGDSLVVAINADLSVRALKGDSRPYVSERERAELVAGFECVDAVVIFSEQRLSGIITELKPDVYAKGGDYSLAKIDQGERSALEACQARIAFNHDFLQEISTTAMINTILGEKK